MFEDQMVELLPARTTMSKKGGKKGKRGGGNTTNTAVAVASNVFVIDARGNADVTIDDVTQVAKAEANAG